MSVGSPGPKSPNTPVSLSRWKEALAGTWFLPPRQWDSWKGIITPGCQDGAGAHRLPRMWLMANLSSKKIGFQGNWKLFSQSQVLQGEFPPVYSPLLPLGQPRTCWDLKKNWQCLTVSLINKKRDRKPGSGLVHERREHTRSASPWVPWLDGYSECPTWWLLRVSYMVTGGSLGWAWAPISSPQHPLSGKEIFIVFSVDYNAKSRGHYGNTKLKSYVCTELSSLLSQPHSEAATQVPLTLCRWEIWEQRRLKDMIVVTYPADGGVGLKSGSW